MVRFINYDKTNRKAASDFYICPMRNCLDRSYLNLSLNIALVSTGYNKYMDFVVEKAPTYKQFVQNMELKLQDPEFLDDTDILLRADADQFDPQHAYVMVKHAFIDKLPGKRD